MPSLFTMMFAPTAGVASYLAWIIESAWACVSSGADLQPAKTIPAPKIAKDIKTFIFATFFTFPPLDTHDWLIYFDPPFLSYFPLLSMELEVTGRTTDRLILWKSPGQPKIEAKLPPSFTAPPVSVPSPRQSGPREIQEIPSRPSARSPRHWFRNSLVVHFQPHRRRRAKIGANRISHCHRVKQSWPAPFFCPGPLVVKQR